MLLQLECNFSMLMAFLLFSCSSMNNSYHINISITDRNFVINGLKRAYYSSKNCMWSERSWSPRSWWWNIGVKLKALVLGDHDFFQFGSFHSICQNLHSIFLETDVNSSSRLYIFVVHASATDTFVISTRFLMWWLIQLHITAYADSSTLHVKK